MKSLTLICASILLLFSACKKSDTLCEYHIVFLPEFYGQTVKVRVDGEEVLNRFIDTKSPTIGNRGAFDFTAKEGRHKIEVQGKDLKYKGHFKLPEDIGIYVSINASNKIEIKTNTLYFEVL